MNPLLVMSIEAPTSVAPFARTCQAAHLLGWVCEHVNQSASCVDATLHFQEAFQISRALQALLKMIHTDSEQSATNRLRLFAARGLAYAALNTLLEVHSCIEPDNLETIGGNRGLRLELQKHALDKYKETISDVLNLASDIEQHMVAHGLGKVPLLVLPSLYSTASMYAWCFREREIERDLNAFLVLRRLLTEMQSKYNVSCKWTILAVQVPTRAANRLV